MQKYFSELENMYFQFERAHQISSTICEKKKKRTLSHITVGFQEKKEKEILKAPGEKKQISYKRLGIRLFQISSLQYATRSQRTSPLKFWEKLISSLKHPSKLLVKYKQRIETYLDIQDLKIPHLLCLRKLLQNLLQQTEGINQEKEEDIRFGKQEVQQEMQREVPEDQLRIRPKEKQEQKAVEEGREMELIGYLRCLTMWEVIFGKIL